MEQHNLKGSTTLSCVLGDEGTREGRRKDGLNTYEGPR
jgi:hypothetical protein